MSRLGQRGSGLQHEQFTSTTPPDMGYTGGRKGTRRAVEGDCSLLGGTRGDSLKKAKEKGSLGSEKED